MPVLLPNGKQYYTTAAGLPGVGYKLYTYQAGTLIPKDTYTSSTGLSVNANPVIANARGEMTVYFTGSYDVYLRDSLDNPIWGPERVVEPEATGTAAALDVILRADLANTADLAKGDALIGVKQPETGSVARTQHAKNAERLNLLDFGAAGSGGDDTPFFQLLVNTRKSGYVPKGNYNITTVNVDTYGCDLLFDKEAVVTVTGGGFQRALLQTLRATFIAANPLLDATNYYYTSRYEGGSFIVGANATAFSDRVPFILYTGVAPAPANPGLPVQRPIVVRDANITLTSSTALGIGIYGGWGALVDSCSIAGYDVGTGVYIGASSADGDTHCQPQEVTLQNTDFNSCTAIDSARNGCTNSCELLNINSCHFNFVQYTNLTSVNAIRWHGGLFVTSNWSLKITDCNNVTISDGYFESNFDPLDSSNPGIINCLNCTDLRIVNSSFLVLTTSVAVARDGILVKAPASNAVQGTLIEGCKFTHATYSATLETNAIRFATGGGSGQLVDVIVRDITCSDWHNAINFTDHITTQAARVQLAGITNQSGVRFLKGIARIFTNTLNAPGLWEQFGVRLSGQSNGSGAATNVLSQSYYSVMYCAAPVVTVTNFVSVANCNGITATWGGLGANGVDIQGAQTAASAAGVLVQGTATITIDGTAV